MLQRIWFWLYRSFSDLPSRQEAAQAYLWFHNRCEGKEGLRTSKHIMRALELYSPYYTHTLETMAQEMGPVTRERVRQLVTKGCARARNYQW